MPGFISRPWGREKGGVGNPKEGEGEKGKGRLARTCAGTVEKRREQTKRGEKRAAYAAGHARLNNGGGGKKKKEKKPQASLLSSGGKKRGEWGRGRNRGGAMAACLDVFLSWPGGKGEKGGGILEEIDVSH